MTTFGIIFGSVLGLYFTVGCLRTGLCWPAVRYEMTRQSEEIGLFGMKPKVQWILPPWLSYAIYSAAWFMWKKEYKDMRTSSKLERLSARTRNKSS